MKRKPNEVARIIGDFLSGACGEWDWDDFISIRIGDPVLDAIRLRCGAVRDEYPPGNGGGYCDEQGRVELARLADQARRLSDRE